MGAIFLAALILAIAKATAGTDAPKSSPGVPDDFKPIGGGFVPATKPTDSGSGDSKMTSAAAPVVSAVDKFAALGSGLKYNPAAPTAGDWPGVRSLPDPYRADALAVLSTVSYANVRSGKPPCTSTALFTCSSAAIYTALASVYTNQKAIQTVAGGLGGVNTDLALQELRQAYDAVKAVGR